MIVANMATYPERAETLPEVLESIAAQVDRVNLVLNEYQAAPSCLRRFDNLEWVIPNVDLKDTGKFLFEVENEDIVFLVDDDFVYPDDYVSKSLGYWKRYAGRSVAAGYHASCYFRYDEDVVQSRRVSREQYERNLSAFRMMIVASRAMEKALIVEQLGTGTTLCKGRHLPPFNYMEGSMGYVDVRFAKWCFEKNIHCLSLPRVENWLRQIPVSNSLYRSTTLSRLEHVEKEIASYAGKVENARRPLNPASP